MSSLREEPRWPGREQTMPVTILSMQRVCGFALGAEKQTLKGMCMTSVQIAASYIGVTLGALLVAGCFVDAVNFLLKGRWVAALLQAALMAFVVITMFINMVALSGQGA